MGELLHELLHELLNHLKGLGEGAGQQGALNRQHPPVLPSYGLSGPFKLSTKMSCNDPTMTIVIITMPMRAYPTATGG